MLKALFAISPNYHAFKNTLSQVFEMKFKGPPCVQKHLKWNRRALNLISSPNLHYGDTAKNSVEEWNGITNTSLWLLFPFKANSSIVFIPRAAD